MARSGSRPDASTPLKLINDDHGTPATPIVNIIDHNNHGGIFDDDDNGGDNNLGSGYQYLD